MRIVIIGSRSIDPSTNNSAVDISVLSIANNIEEAINILKNTVDETMVLLTDCDQDTFHKIIEKSNLINHPVKVLMINNKKRYFILGDNSYNNSIKYHIPI